MDDEPRPGRDRWVTLGVVLLGLFSYGTTTTVLAASLATVGEDLGASTTVLAWTVTGPFLALGIGNPVFGKVGDIHGRRRVYLLGTALFGLATLASAAAPGAGALVALRAVAGIGAAAAVPTGMALVLARFSSPERPRAMGWFNLVGTGAPAIGLVLGGPLIDAFGWRSVFAVYGSISLGALFLALAVVPASTPGPRIPVDLAGAATLGLATFGLMLGLTVGAQGGFGHPGAFVPMTLAPFGLVAFVAIERRTPHPLVPLRYFTHRNFSAPLAGFFSAHVAYMGGFVVTPILLGEALGFRLSAITAILLLRPLSFSLASPVGGALAIRFGERRAALSGSAAMVASMGAFLVASGTSSMVAIVGALVCSGIALGLSAPSYAAAVTDAADPTDLGLASGMLQTFASLGTVVGIQTALFALGDGPSRQASDFSAPFTLGLVAALVMLTASLSVRPLRR